MGVGVKTRMSLVAVVAGLFAPALAPPAAADPASPEPIYGYTALRAPSDTAPGRTPAPARPTAGGPAETGTLPDGCYKTSMVYTSRVRSCLLTPVSIVITNLRTGKVAGRVTIDAVTVVDTQSRGSTRVDSRVYVRAYARSGEGAKAFTINTKHVCTSASSNKWCNAVAGSGAITVPAGVGGTAWYIHRGSITPALSANDVVRVSSKWSVSAVGPGGVVMRTAYTNPTSPRCDSGVALKGTVGCVLTGWVSTVAYSKSSTAHGQVAKHIAGALAWGISSIMTKADGATTTANRAKACPSAVKNGSWSCDEFPFASSNQGAAAGGPMMIPPGCNAATVHPLNPTWSRCWVSLAQNNSAGGTLTAMYTKDRVLGGDKFKVVINP